MTEPLVPGCPVGHRRWVYVVWAALVLALLLAALLWPSWWLTALLGVAAFCAAFHPVCRFTNRHGTYHCNPEER